MKHVISCGLYCALATILSCDFHPDGVVLTKVQQADLNGMYIELNGYPGNTIQLKQPTVFSYTFHPAGKTILSWRVSFNNQVREANNTNQFFTLNPADYPTGNYTLLIDFIADPGTGSLANKVGAEQILVSLQKTIAINNDVPQNPSDPGAVRIRSVRIVDGTVKVSWTPYTNFNFEHFSLTRDDYDADGNRLCGTGVPTISDTVYYDHQYLGGKSVYTLWLYAAGKIYTAPPYTFDNGYVPAITSTSSIVDGMMTVKWNGLRSLENNFNNYDLTITNVYSQPIFTYTSTNLADTSATFQLPTKVLGETYGAKLKFYSKEESYCNRVANTFLVCGQAFPPFSYGGVRYDAFTHTYLAFGYFYVYKADEEGHKIDSVYKADLNSSYELIANKTYALMYSSIDEKIYIINLVTMKREGVFPSPAGYWPFGISSDNKVGIRNQTGAKIVNWDGSDFFTLETTTPELNNYGAGMTPDGKYIWASTKMYKFDGSQYSYYINWYWGNGENYNLTISEEEPAKALVANYNQVQWYDLDANTQGSTSYVYHGPGSYDPVSGKVGAYSGQGAFVILNADLTVYKTMPLAYSGRNIIVNDHVLTWSGAFIKLSDVP